MIKTYKTTGTVRLNIQPGRPDFPVLTVEGQQGYWDGTINGEPAKQTLYIADCDGDNWVGLLEELSKQGVIPSDSDIDWTERDGAWASHYSSDWHKGLDGVEVSFETVQDVILDVDGEIEDIGDRIWKAYVQN